MSSGDSTATVEYREISGYPGYRVGNDGSVWTSKIVGANGRTGPEWRRMTIDINRHGYGILHLCHLGKSRVRYVHQLILEAFVGPKPEGGVCRHLNGVRNDNRIENICWGTLKENASDMVRHGTAQIGEKHHKAILTPEQAIEIHRRANAGESHQKLGKEFGLNPGTISSIKHSRNWRHILPPRTAPPMRQGRKSA